jgi:hypothetical protein
MLVKTTELADLQVLLGESSPLTDSNRRPSPYHGGCTHSYGIREQRLLARFPAIWLVLLLVAPFL